jgi:hypothetical protein
MGISQAHRFDDGRNDTAVIDELVDVLPADRRLCSRSRRTHLLASSLPRHTHKGARVLVDRAWRAREVPRATRAIERGRRGSRWIPMAGTGS